MYNYYFEIAAAVFVLYALINVLFHRKLQDKKTKTYLEYTVACLIRCVASILLGVGMEQHWPVFSVYTLLIIFPIVSLCGAVLFFDYTLEVTPFSENRKKNIAAVLDIAVGVVLLLIATNPLTNIIFEVNFDRITMNGILLPLVYSIIIAIALIQILLMLIHRKTVRKNDRAVIYIYAASTIICAAWQSMHSMIPISGLGQAVVLMFISSHMQSSAALTDGVSGISNDLVFRDQVDYKLKKKQQFAVLYIHLNKFNGISSVINYKNADSVVAAIADFLSELCGKNNVYHIESHVFGVILPEDPVKERRTVMAVQKRFAQSWKTEQMDLNLNANLVVCYAGKQFETVAELEAIRDYLMEEAKKQGLNSIIIADDELKTRFERYNEVERAIYRAIATDSLEVYFQPIVSLHEETEEAQEDGKPVYKATEAEALVRFNDPVLGMLTSAELIPVAEHNGSITVMDRQIFEKTCRFISEHLLPHPELGVKTIHINLSAAQCMQSDMSDHMIHIIEKYQIPKDFIDLEITDRSTANLSGHMKEHMEHLAAYGVSFSVNDFSISSDYSWLVDSACKTVKFGRETTDTYFKEDSARSLIGSYIHAQDEMGFKKAIVGIETQEQLELISKENVDTVQGYLFAKPLTQADYLDYLRNHQNSAL